MPTLSKLNLSTPVKLLPLLLTFLAAATAASAATYQVGPTRAHTQLSTVATIVNAGDVIELDAGFTYNWVRFTRPGSAAQPITLRGTAGGSQRPIIDATSSAGTGLQLDTNHYVIEDVVVRNASTRCIYLHGHNLTLRRVVAHTCATHGILGADNDTGDLTLTEVEVYNQGNATTPSQFHHPIYIATDHELYPNAVLRIERSWVHDNNSGNSIKSRARNVKIFYNWLETTNGQNHTIEAIGPDGQECPVPNGSNSAQLCNGEIIGNVLLARGNNPNMMRLGGDGTGNSYGRYHLVNNTFIANGVFSAPAAMIRAFGNIDSIELHNNIFWIQNGNSGAFRIIRDIEAEWASGARKVTGKNNLITGSQANYNANPSYIAGLTNTIFASTAAAIFVNIDLANPATLDLRLRIDSVARAAGHAASTTSPGYEIPNPTNLPQMQPPRMRPTPGQLVATARPQPTDNNGVVLPGVVGLGAYEYAIAAPTLAENDFNGDGKPDLIWSNTANGATYIWRMNGTSLLSDQLLSTIDPIWKVQGIGDFNGDGHNDVVWRHTGTGNTYVWYLVNGVFQSDAFLFSLPPEWVIQGVADFNADDKPDFLMRNVNSGNAFAWFFNNNVAIGDQFLFNVDPLWKVEGVADLNADGQPDLLFRNMNSGLAFAWNTQFAAGTLSLGTASSPIFGIDPAWEIVQIADWNADNKPDLVFRNKNSGLVFVWYMNGTTLTTSAFITQIDPSWEIVPRR